MWDQLEQNRPEAVEGFEILCSGKQHFSSNNQRTINPRTPLEVLETLSKYTESTPPAPP